MHDYKLHISSDQAHLIEAALDFYARVLAGQVEEVSYRLSLNRDDLGHDDRVVLRVLCSEMRRHIGIKFDGTSDRLYDMVQALRYKLAWDENPQGGKDTRFNKPMFKSCDTPIEVERLEKQF